MIEINVLPIIESDIKIGYFLNKKKVLKSSKMGANLIRVAVTPRLEISNINGEFVFLIASQVRIAHEIKCILVMARAWCNEIQFNFSLLL